MSKSTQINIKGMHCSGCESVIEEALAELDGVTEVTVDYPTALCSVSFDQKKLSLETIHKLIEDNGYQVELAPENKASLLIKISLSLLALIAIVLLMVGSRKLWHQFSVPEIS